MLKIASNKLVHTYLNNPSLQLNMYQSLANFRLKFKFKLIIFNNNNNNNRLINNNNLILLNNKILMSLNLCTKLTNNHLNSNTNHKILKINRLY